MATIKVISCRDAFLSGIINDRYFQAIITDRPSVVNLFGSRVSMLYISPNKSYSRRTPLDKQMVYGYDRTLQFNRLVDFDLRSFVDDLNKIPKIDERNDLYVRGESYEVD